MTRIFITAFFISLTLTGFAQRLMYSDETIISMFSKVGEVHNNGLDAVLNDLNRDFGTVYRGGNTLNDRNTIYRRADESIQKYLKTDLQTRDMDTKQFINHEVEIKNILGKDLVSAIRMYAEGRTLSALFLDAMNELNNIMDNESICFNQSAYTRLINNYIGKLSTYKEKAYLVAMVNTAYQSSLYWQNNTDRWKNFFSNSGQAKSLVYFMDAPFAAFANWNGSIPNKNYFNWGKKVAKADVTGIVAGGINGCISGAVGGTVVVPGAGTVGGCLGVGIVGAVGGGLTASTAAAVSSFFDWLFS